MFNPLSVTSDWWGSAFKAWEISVAAPQVIARRTLRMMQGSMEARDHKELTLMGQEKFEAFGESWLAMAVQIQKLNAQAATAALRQMFATWSALASFTTATTTQQIVRAQTAFLRSLIVADSRRDLSTAIARLVAEGIHPVHSRATANAKRLGNKR
jgi:hypothetical protein